MRIIYSPLRGGRLAECFWESDTIVLREGLQLYPMLHAETLAHEVRHLRNHEAEKSQIRAAFNDAVIDWVDAPRFLGYQAAIDLLLKKSYVERAAWFVYSFLKNRFSMAAAKVLYLALRRFRLVRC